MNHLTWPDVAGLFLMVLPAIVIIYMKMKD